MKLTKTQLKQIIKEELQKVLQEQDACPEGCPPGSVCRPTGCTPLNRSFTPRKQSPIGRGPQWDDKKCRKPKDPCYSDDPACAKYWACEKQLALKTVSVSAEKWAQIMKSNSSSGDAQTGCPGGGKPVGRKADGSLICPPAGTKRRGKMGKHGGQRLAVGPPVYSTTKKRFLESGAE